MSDLTPGYVFSPAELDVNSVKLNGLVNAAVIKPGVVTTPKLADDAATTAKIADEAVTTAKLATRAVTLAKLSEDAGQQGHLYAAATEAENLYTVALDPAPTVLAAGMIVRFKADAANTGAASIEVNALAAKALRKNGGSPLAAGDIVAGEVVTCVYDGTHFQVGALARMPAASVAPADPATDHVPYRAADGILRSATLLQVRGATGIDRQTVICGPVSTSGRPAVIGAAGSNPLNLSIYATAEAPLGLSFADGWDTGGPREFRAGRTSSLGNAWTALPVNDTSYLYAELSEAMDLSYGHTTLAPVYSRTAPAAPATGQHWFDRVAARMKRWDGSAWVPVLRLFVGEAVTGGDAVSSVFSYAFRGEFEGEAAVPGTGGAPFVLSHQIGRAPATLEIGLRCLTAEWGWAVGDESIGAGFMTISNNHGYSASVNANQIKFVQHGNLYLHEYANPSPDVRILTPANWRLVFRATSRL